MDSCNESLPLSAMTLLDRGQLQFSEDKYVTRTMKCLPDKFVELCHMHLAFLLDLSGGKLELLLSSPHKKRKSGLVSVGMFRKKDKSHAGLFGLPLTDEGVCLMIPLIKFLQLERNICKEGLFRKPGNKTRMNRLKDLLVAQGSAVNIDSEIFSSYDVACVLKEFLRELPEPLLTDRHLEAHKQILALGQHASSAEEKAWYASRKLSALQLLMLLLPPAAQKLTNHLMRLLQRIADCPDTKMTTATLGTIFAPIFFIDRKVDPSELCSQVADTSPGVSFMVENAHDLFHAPRELVADLTSYWSSLGPAPVASGSTSESSQMKKSTSGRTIYTGVCYIDRELSRCEDVTSHTQAELASLLAHVQALPDTPHNARLKKQMVKTTTTPLVSGKKHRRSKSIIASIKKRLPSLRRLRNKHEHFTSTSAPPASSEECQISVRGNPHPNPAYPVERGHSQRQSRPGHKRLYTSDSENISPFPICTPPKQKCNEAPGISTNTTPAMEDLTPTRNMCGEDGADENIDPDTVVSLEIVNDSQAVSRLSLSRPQLALMQSETKIAYLPHLAEQHISAPVVTRANAPVTVSISAPLTLNTGAPVISNNTPVAPIISSPVTLSSSAPVTPTYIAPVTPTNGAPVTLSSSAPVTPTNGAPVTLSSSAPVTPTNGAPVTLSSSAPATPTNGAPVTLSSSAPVTPTNGAPVTLSSSAPVTPTNGAPVTLSSSAPVTPVLANKAHLRPCRKRGTPIMQRAVLRMVPCNTPESSF